MNDTVSQIVAAVLVFAVAVCAGLLLADASKKTVEAVIAEGRILLKMTQDHVRRAWGEPDQITTTQTLVPEEEKPLPTYEVTVVWMYNDPYRTVTFKKGRVVEFSETRERGDDQNVSFLHRILSIRQSASA